MKKYILALFAVFMLGACSSKVGFAGKTYILQNAMEPAKVIIGFDANEPKFYGSVVNRYFGGYSINGSTISLQPEGATMMMGPEAEMKAEAEWLQYLLQITEYTLKGNELILKTKTGKEFLLKETSVED